MNTLLLLRKVGALRGCGKLVCVSSNAHVCSTARDVHPKSSEHLASAMTFDQGVKLGDSGGQGGSIDLAAFKLNDGTFVCAVT